ncbi:unnamed protein product [Parnassius apollo]|uniref:(apollo) hypothetical protein n=1 Tax=Parnassius apollo TaxID=110799 RepID=A0A8S3WP08_PARAO|nr:unnamed protein product [Parnassius apollo]
MSKAVLVCVLVLVTFSFIKCKKPKTNDARTKDISSTTTVTPTSKEQDERSIIDMMNIMKDCNETFRIEMSYLEQLNNSGSFSDETDRTPKCYIRCVLETSGVATQDGQFDPALAALVVADVRGGGDSNELEEFATSCLERKETCKCERSYQFIKCLMEKEVEKLEKTK